MAGCVWKRADQGIYDALNKAVRRAQGDFLLILGADDRLRLPLDELRPLLRDDRTVYYDVWRSPPTATPGRLMAPNWREPISANKPSCIARGVCRSCFRFALLAAGRLGLQHGVFCRSAASF